MGIDLDSALMLAGFCLAAYSVVGNDVMQTLGTFLSSNSTRPWWVLWLFAGSILASVLLYSWFVYEGDPAYGRLTNFPLPKPFNWFYVLPPIILMILTRYGFPVSTTFLILSLFGTKNIGGMVVKSLLGYAIALISAMVIYWFITEKIEKKFIDSEVKNSQNHKTWVVLQWISTGFLWSQWLIQDLANIYVYMPRKIGTGTLLLTIAIVLALLAYIFRARGGAIQKIVTSKTNTNDIRSATIIDLIYGVIMYLFKEGYVMYLVGMSPNKIPMSTTWIFIGLLAGREIAMRYRLMKGNVRPVLDEMFRDVGKAGAGLAVSVALVMLIKYLAGEPIPFL